MNRPLIAALWDAEVEREARRNYWLGLVTGVCGTLVAFAAGWYLW